MNHTIKLLDNDNAKAIVNSESIKANLIKQLMSALLDGNSL